MGKVYDGIDEKLSEFIRSQRLFFVASAPLASAGHVNLSPKGLDSLRILAPDRVAYLDVVGSGAETLAHVRENGRIVFMFCAFEGPPRIVRLHGRARVVEPGEAEWPELAGQFPDYPSARSVIVADISRVADSCGYGVPLYHFESERNQIPDWAERKGPGGLRRYQDENNRESLDGLPALLRPLEKTT